MIVFPKANHRSFASSNWYQHWTKLLSLWQNFFKCEKLLLWLNWGHFAHWEQIQIHPSSSFSPQEFSSFRCLTFYNDQWIARLTSFKLWCSNVAFLSTSWFTPSPRYLLLEVKRSFGCVGKEKELHQIVNIWPFSAEHSFSCQLETCCCEQG